MRLGSTRCIKHFQEKGKHHTADRGSTYHGCQHTHSQSHQINFGWDLYKPLNYWHKPNNLKKWLTKYTWTITYNIRKCSEGHISVFLCQQIVTYTKFLYSADPPSMKVTFQRWCVNPKIMYSQKYHYKSLNFPKRACFCIQVLSHVCIL